MKKIPSPAFEKLTRDRQSDTGLQRLSFKAAAGRGWRHRGGDAGTEIPGMKGLKWWGRVF